VAELRAHQTGDVEQVAGHVGQRPGRYRWNSRCATAAWTYRPMAAPSGSLRSRTRMKRVWLPAPSKQALVVPEANAVLEQKPDLPLTGVDRAHVAGVGVAEADAVPAAVDALGQVRLARQDGLAHPQRQVGQAWVGLGDASLVVRVHCVGM
jgi:hypothetical protein